MAERDSETAAQIARRLAAELDREIEQSILGDDEDDVSGQSLGLRETEESGQVGAPNIDDEARNEVEKSGEQQPISPTEPPNVRLAHDREPPSEELIIIGPVQVKVPDRATQRAGFYTEHAAILVSHYVGTYKTMLDAGQSRQAQLENGGEGQDGDQTQQ